MKILLLLALAIAGLLVLLRWQGNSSGKSKKAQVKATKVNRVKNTAGVNKHLYGATTVVIDENACEAARALADKPFLDSDKETPLLPLANCTAAKCTCRYVHQQDRRDIGEDRRFGTGMLSEHYATGQKETRRAGKGGRREHDK